MTEKRPTVGLVVPVTGGTDRAAPGWRIWNMTDKDLIDELSRPVPPSNSDAYLVLRVAVGRILERLVKLDTAPAPGVPSKVRDSEP